MADSYEHLKAHFDRIAAENRSQHELRRWTLDNIYTIARRELNRLQPYVIPDTLAIERWGHVLRLCEKAGCQPRGVLRDNGGPAGEPDFGPESDTPEDRGYPPPRCEHEWGINGCQKCGQPAMPRG